MHLVDTFVYLFLLASAIMVLITASDRTGLFCSSVSLIESVQSSTVFCSISGKYYTVKCIHCVLQYVL